ncbi:MAG TPA: NAD(P)/FAD-dependent oxidoreductase [Candidatus Eremiobacteraceae bacterium]|nr:NAD(P)/FAD-dependent oxidoreductase [Candidatus Eremiobacteraceae bacterium]
MELFDITVIGGGPSGLFALFYAGMRGAKAKVIDVLPELGGQLYALYPEKYIYDMPGFPAIVAQDLVKGCVDQAFQWPHAKCLEERVSGIERTPDDHFIIRTDKGEHLTRAIVITTGIGAFRPRKLAAPTAEPFEGRGLQYYARTFESFDGKRVVVVGGGDSAVDYALALVPRAQRVMVVHRSAFRAHAATVDRLRATNALLHQPDHEIEIVHGDGHVEAVTVVNKKTKEAFKWECDAVLCALGFVSDLGAVKEWGIEVEGNGIVVNTATQETSVKGIYAAGDVVSHEGKLKLIACGTSEAAIAVNQAMHYINPSDKVHPIHSSNLTLPITATLTDVR